MLEMINGEKMISDELIAEKYPGCKFLLVDINNDIENLKGKLYCVSHSADSFAEISEIYKDFRLSGKEAALLGIYTDSCAPGLYRVVKN